MLSFCVFLSRIVVQRSLVPPKHFKIVLEYLRVMTSFFPSLGEGNRSIDEGSAGRVVIQCAAFKNNTVIGQTAETEQCVESH